MLPAFFSQSAQRSKTSLTLLLLLLSRFSHVQLCVKSVFGGSLHSLRPVWRPAGSRPAETKAQRGEQSTQGYAGRQQRDQGYNSGLGDAKAPSPQSHCSMSFQVSSRSVYLCWALAARPGGQEQEEASCGCSGWPRCLSYLRWRRA